MKTNFIKLLSMLAVAALLTVGIVALAEPAEDEFAEDATTQTEEIAETETATADDAAYEEAYSKYRQALVDNRLDEFKTELSQMVEKGQLTQAQADLLIERAEAQISLANGTCPDCGANLSGYGYGRGNGGMKGGMGGGRGGMRGRG